MVLFSSSCFFVLLVFLDFGVFLVTEAKKHVVLVNLGDFCSFYGTFSRFFYGFLCYLSDCFAFATYGSIPSILGGS